MLVAWLPRAFLAAFGPVLIWLSADTPVSAQPAPVAPQPPPCWCDQNATDHTQASDHPYTPAHGIEAEADDAW